MKTVYINEKPFDVWQETLTPTLIKSMAEAPVYYGVNIATNDPVWPWDDVTEEITIHGGEHFFTTLPRGGSA